MSPKVGGNLSPILIPDLSGRSHC